MSRGSDARRPEAPGQVRDYDTSEDGPRMNRLRTVLAILSVVAAILVIWYAGSFLMNRAWVMDQAVRAGTAPTFSEVMFWYTQLPVKHVKLNGAYEPVCAK